MQELAHQIVSEHSREKLHLIIWGLLYINILYLTVYSGILFQPMMMTFKAYNKSKNVKYFDKSNFKVFSQIKNHMF